MIVSKTYLEGRVKELRCWLDHYPGMHHARKLKEQNLRYYAQKLVELEELKLEYIKI